MSQYYVCGPTGACVYSPPPCNDECSNGQKRCNGDWSENCGNYDTSDTCLEWGSAEYCPNYGANYHCDPGSGACVYAPPACSDECSSGQKRCNGQWSENCGNFDGDSCLEWGSAEYCPNYGQHYVCGPTGACVYSPPSCDACSPGTKRCIGDWSDNCGDWNGDGCAEWGNGEWCPNYGPNIHCDPGSGYCVGG